MFVAVREIRVGVRGKPGPLIIAAGEQIPDEIDWPYDTLSCQMSAGNIRWEGEGEPNLNRGVVIPQGYRDTNLKKSKPVEPSKTELTGTILECCGSKFKTRSGLSAHKRAKHAAPAAE